MFQERYNRIVLPFIFFIDLFILLGLYFFFFQQTQFYYLLLIILFWSIPSLYFNSYHVRRTYSIITALRPMINTISVFLFSYVISILLDVLPMIDRSLQIYFVLTNFILLLIAGFSRYLFFYHYRLHGKNIRNAVILGQNISSEEFENLNRDAPHFGYRFVENIPTSENFIQKLKNLLTIHKIDLIFLKEQSKPVTDSVSAFCDEHGLRLKLLLPLSVTTGRRAGLDQIGGYPVMDLRYEPLLYLGNRFLKRTLDIVMSSLSILFILTWLPFLVKLFQVTSYPGPLFFIQERIGRGGKIFYLYKFRTMFHTSEEKFARKGQAERTHKVDTRVPWFGSILRRTNLDEYPQFLNVLFGSMSTVGPRPHMVREDDMLEKNVPRYRIRRFIKPGITGWAGINGYRGGTDDMALMTKRTAHDIWYLENWTIWLDIKIMAITVWQMLTFRIPRAY